MKFVDEFRDSRTAPQLVSEILRVARRRWTIMEVCGGQTHGLLKYGIDEALADRIELIHGPGCPVCVTPVSAIDFACQLARRPGCMVATFGDMLRVPGTNGSLSQAGAEGGAVRAIYSPLDAVQLARERPDLQVVLFAVGFETTAPATALAARQAVTLGLENFSLLVAHVRVQPAMEKLLADPQHRVQAFLAAGHVATVVGYDSYESLVEQHRVPVVVTGFEPLDLLAGLLAAVTQLESGEARVENRYGRSARREGNRAAQALLDSVYEPCDGPWRGLGQIEQGCLRLRDELSFLDARRRFGEAGETRPEAGECRSGEVLAGLLKPPECSAFGTRCVPESPLGAPMVSDEGACAAYYRYGRRSAGDTAPHA